MNNDRTNIDSQEARQALKTELVNVLGILKRGEVPDAALIEKVHNTMKTVLLFAGQEDLTTEKGKSGKLLPEVLQEENVSVRLDNTILRDIDNLKMLKALVYEKLISVIANNTFIEQLKHAGLVTELTLKKGNYYTFTSRGWYWISLDETKGTIKDVDETFAIPDKVIPDITEWTEETFYQIECIKEYFDVINASGFMIFSDAKCFKMQLGCEINDSYEANYCYAVSNSGEIESEDAIRLYEMSAADTIQALTILINSEHEKKRLRLKKGLDENDLSKLRYFVLSEE